MGAAAGADVVLRLLVLSVVLWGSRQAACSVSAVTGSSADLVCAGAVAAACPVCQHDVDITPLWHWGGSEDLAALYPSQWSCGARVTESYRLTNRQAGGSPQGVYPQLV